MEKDGMEKGKNIMEMSSNMKLLIEKNNIFSEIFD